MSDTSPLAQALSDRYVIERELGQGGMATVYLARDLKHERQVAIKVLRPELAAALGPERFLQEIKIAANLNHPHILPLLDSGTAEEQRTALPPYRPTAFLYYVMPYVEGQSLRDKLAKEGELPIGEAVRILRDVVDALSHAHKHNVVHRDIKPDNVMLSERHALVTDFGVAKAVSDATGAVGLTTEGVALGTPAYMAPEQAAADSHIDHRADIYAVGVVAYELLTGRAPFLGTTPQMILSAHLADVPDPVSKYRESVPPALEQLVMKCLEKKAADRWQSAEELLPQLETLATPSGGVTPTGTMPVGTARRVPAWSLGAVAVLAVVVLALAFWQPWASDSVSEEGAPRAWTILAEVEGTAPEDIRELVRNLLAGDIDASGSFVVLSDDAIRRGLVSAMKPDTTRLVPSVARELAERAEIGTVFAPELDQIGGTYALRMRVLDVTGDSVLSVERVQATNDDALIPASREIVERSTSVLSASLDGEIRPPRTDLRVTFSLTAFRKLREASSANSRGRYREAIALCREALAIDTEFAGAWTMMGSAYDNAGFADSARYARAEALKYPDRLSEYARQRQAAIVADDWMARLRVEERRHNETGDNFMLYGQVLADGFGRYEETIHLYEQHAAQSPFGLSAMRLSNWVGYLLALGRVQVAESLAVGLAGTPRDLPFRALIALRKADWAEAERLAMQVIADPAMNVRWRSTGIWILASARAARGQLRAATTALHEMVEFTQQSGNAQYYYRSHMDLLTLTVVGALDPEPWQLQTLESDTTARARVLLGLWAAQSGDTALAQSYLDALSGPELGEFDAPTVQHSLVAALDAHLAALHENWEEAARTLAPVTGDRSPRAEDSSRLPNWLRAEAEERLGNLEQAATLYSQIADGYRFGDYEVNGFGLTYSFAHRKAALLYAQLEAHDRAEDHWLAFLDAFTDPDPEFEWMVEEGREEVERLGRGR